MGLVNPRSAPVAEETDSDLARRAADGDRAAFESIYRRHADRVFALLTRLVGPDREREDLLQEVFIKLHPALARFRFECSLQTFVYRITVRIAIDHLRGKKPVDLVDDLDLDAEIDPGLSPADHAARAEELAGAFALLAKLKPKHRVAFVLREVMALSHDEVARIVDVHPAAARMRVALAKRALARLTGKEQG